MENKIKTIDTEIHHVTDEEIDYTYNTSQTFLDPMFEEFHENNRRMSKMVRLNTLVEVLNRLRYFIDEESYNLSTEWVSDFFMENPLEKYIDISKINNRLYGSDISKKHLIYLSKKSNKHFLFAIFKEIYRLNRVSFTYTDETKFEIDEVFLPIIYIRLEETIGGCEWKFWVSISKELNAPYSKDDSVIIRRKQVKLVMARMKTKVLIIQDIQYGYYCSIWNELINLAEELNITLIGLESAKNIDKNSYDDISDTFEIIKAPDMPHSFKRVITSWA